MIGVELRLGTIEPDTKKGTSPNHFLYILVDLEE